MKNTEKQAKEYFVKLTCDAYSKEDLARQIWKDMDSDKRKPYFEKSEETKNIYDLYEPKNQTEKDYLIKATKEITNAINSKKWNNVEKLQIKYKEIGANDTASNDEIIEVWKNKYGKSPPGWI